MDSRPAVPDPAGDLAPGEVTRLLAGLGDGDEAAAYDRLLPLIYDELHRRARGLLRHERPGHTLHPTALVNEAYLRLVGQHEQDWASRGHFFGIAAVAMRRILVDHARSRRRREQRDREHFDLLAATATAAQADALDLLALDEAMTKLAGVDPRKVKVVELRYFVGLDVAQTAAALGMSPATVKRDWTTARVWLKTELAGDE